VASVLFADKEGWMRGRVFFIVAAILALVPGVARAQSAFAGVVKDTTGAILPGVTVEAGEPGVDREGARRADR
jgi:hypothetical protein